MRTYLSVGIITVCTVLISSASLAQSPPRGWVNPRAVPICVDPRPQQHQRQCTVDQNQHTRCPAYIELKSCGWEVVADQQQPRPLTEWWCKRPRWQRTRSGVFFHSNVCWHWVR
jgi:hypothetical protein